jgi:hypothetical protein
LELLMILRLIPRISRFINKLNSISRFSDMYSKCRDIKSFSLKARKVSLRSSADKQSPLGHCVELLSARVPSVFVHAPRGSGSREVSREMQVFAVVMRETTALVKCKKGRIWIYSI